MAIRQSIVQSIVTPIVQSITGGDTGFSVANQAFPMGDKTLAASGDWTFSASTGTIDSIGVVTGANATDFTVTEAAGVVTVKTNAGAPANGPYSLTIPCFDGPAQTGNQDDVIATITTPADTYSYANQAQYDALVALADVAIDGDTLQGRDGITITPGSGDWDSSRNFAAGLTFTADDGAQVTFDDKLDFDQCGNITLDGGDPNEFKLKFVIPVAVNAAGVGIKGLDTFESIGCHYVGASQIDPNGDYRPRIAVSSVSGTFQVGEILAGASTTYVIVELDLGNNSIVLDGSQGTPNDTAEFTSLETLTGQTSLATCTIDAPGLRTTATPVPPAGQEAIDRDIPVQTDHVIVINNKIEHLTTHLSLSANLTLTVEGNLCDTAYEDILHITRSATETDPTISISWNFLTGIVANSKFYNNPHGDAGQIFDNTGLGEWALTLAQMVANIFLTKYNTNPFGEGSGQGIPFADSAVFFKGWTIIGNMVHNFSNHGITVENFIGGFTERNLCITSERTTDTHGGSSLRVNRGDDVGTSMSFYNLGDGVIYGTGPVLVPPDLASGQDVIMGLRGATISYDDIFVGDGVNLGPWTPTTFKEFQDWYTTKGIYVEHGPSSIITWPTTTPGNDGLFDTSKRPPVEVVTFDPADGATDVSIAKDPTLTFNQPIAFGTGNVTAFDDLDATIEAFDVATEEGTSPGQIEANDVDMIMHMTADFNNEEDVYIQVAATAIDGSLTGNSYAGISDKTTWNFTTEAAIAGFSVVWTDHDEDTGTADNYTFDKGGSGLDFGTPDANREIMAFYSNRGGTQRTSIGATIGGVAATLVSGSVVINGTSTGEWYIAAVPTDADLTATIDYGSGNTTLRCGVEVVAVYNRTSTDDVKVATAAGSTTGPSVSIDIEANGYVIAGLSHSGGSTPVATWGNIDEDDKSVVEGTIMQFAASRAYVSQSLGQTIDVTWDVAAANQAMSVIALS